MAQFTVNASRFDPYKNFKFRVKWDGKYVAGVSKCSALKRTTEVIEHREGGDPSTSRKSPGRSKYEAITLERGVTHDVEFEQWANKVWNFGSGLGSEVSLADFRKDIIIEVYNEAGQLAIAYKVFRCWVSEYQSLPDLDANANAVAIQTHQARERGDRARLRGARALRAELRRAVAPRRERHARHHPAARPPRRRPSPVDGRAAPADRGGRSGAARGSRSLPRRAGDGAARPLRGAHRRARGRRGGGEGADGRRPGGAAPAPAREPLRRPALLPRRLPGVRGADGRRSRRRPTCSSRPTTTSAERTPSRSPSRAEARQTSGSSRAPTRRRLPRGRDRGAARALRLRGAACGRRLLPTARARGGPLRLAPGARSPGGDHDRRRLPLVRRAGRARSSTPPGSSSPS